MKLIQLSSVFVVAVLFLSFKSSEKIKVDDPQGYALIVSVPKVNNSLLKIKYNIPAGNSYADLSGASLDGARIKNILEQQGFRDSNIICLGTNATDIVTEEDIIAAFKKMASRVKANDLFVFYYSGHGTQVKDQPGGDEADGMDEVLVTYKSYLLDDNINEIYKKNFSTTRNVQIVDACHGGSMYEIFKKKSLTFIDNTNAERVDKTNSSSGCSSLFATDEKTGFKMLYYGASRDENNGYDIGNGGYFTASLAGVYNIKTWKGIKPQDLACRISTQMKAIGDPGKGEIKYAECGKPGDDLKKSYLFKIK